MCGGIKAGVFDGRANEGGAGLWAKGARDDVDFVTAMNFAEPVECGRQLHAQHLAFAGANGRRMIEILRLPCSGGVDDGLRSLSRGAEFGVLAEFYVSRPDGGEQSRGELAGIERVFGEAIDGSVWTVLQRSVRLEGDGYARELLDACEETWVELGTKLGERQQRRRVVGVEGGKHPGCGGGGVGERGVTLDYEDAGTAGMEFQGEGEADNAGTGDEDIRRESGLICGGVRGAGGHPAILAFSRGPPSNTFWRVRIKRRAVLFVMSQDVHEYGNPCV